MQRKMKFKIISCSSEEIQHPVSSLLFNTSQGWETKRFCTYPQEITLQFYGIASIKKIELISNHRKISSQVDILYYVPLGTSQNNRFYKYGYLQFNRNEVGNIRQQKTIMVDINCLYIRFLFHKPYQSKENFFSQIGIHQIAFYGSDGDHNLLHLENSIVSDKSFVESQSQNHQEQDQYVYQKIMTYNALKEKAVEAEDFDTANLYKSYIAQIKKLGVEIRNMKLKIKDAVERDDFEEAKRIKEEIEKTKHEIDSILQNEEEEVFEEEQDVVNDRDLDYQDNQFVDPSPQSAMRNRKNSQASESRVIKKSRLKNSKASENQYDDRVVPALLNKHQKTEHNEELNQFQNSEQNKKIQFQVEPIEGKYIKDATQLQQYFDQDIVNKFFSRHWQHKVQALTKIQQQTGKMNKDANLLKSLLTAVKHCMRETNFQVSQSSLSLLQNILKINRQSQLITKPGQLQNDLDEISKEIIKKLSDNNGKIKSLSESVFNEMLESTLYGVESCSLSLTKVKGKLSSKQIISRLEHLMRFVKKYGVANGANSVPTVGVDFAIGQLDNPASEVRNQAIHLLNAAYQKDHDKVEQKISHLKQHLVDLIKDKNGENAQKHKK